MKDVRDLQIRIKADNLEDVRAALGGEVRRILVESGLPQNILAELLGIDQSEVSRLINGQYKLFSESRLFGFLDKLGKDVSVVIKDAELERFKQEYLEDFTQRFSRAVSDALTLPIKRGKHNAP